MKKHLYFFVLVILFGCSDQQPSTKQAPTTNATPAAPATFPLPSIPIEVVQKLWNECTSIDYLFYDLPMSMSLTEQKSIQFAIRHISDSPAPDRPDCKPTGRLTYQIKGDIYLEADFYFTKNK